MCKQTFLMDDWRSTGYNKYAYAYYSDALINSQLSVQKKSKPKNSTEIVNALHFMRSDGCSAGIHNSRWDPIIRQTRTPPPGFHSSSVYHMALSSWAPLTDNERRQPVQLQAKHSAFYRPKHVSGKLTVSIQFCSAFNTHHNASATVPWPLHTSVLLKGWAWDGKN